MCYLPAKEAMELEQRVAVLGESRASLKPGSPQR